LSPAARRRRHERAARADRSGRTRRDPVAGDGVSGASRM